MKMQLAIHQKLSKQSKVIGTRLQMQAITHELWVSTSGKDSATTTKSLLDSAALRGSRVKIPVQKLAPAVIQTLKILGTFGN